MRMLIALDGSVAAERVLEAIRPIANVAGTELTLLTVVDASEMQATTMPAPVFETTPRGTDSGAPLGIPDLLPRLAEDRTQAIVRVEGDARTRLERMAREQLPQAACSVRAVESDHTAAAILEQARAVGADAIAMGTHGRTGLGRVLMGSVAERVVREAPIPVLLVHTAR